MTKKKTTFEIDAATALDDDTVAESHTAWAPVAPSMRQPTRGSNVGPLRRPPTGELAARVRVSEYEIENKIGEGAMGTVYRAVHPTIGKHVAVKIMRSHLCDDADAVERFTREARAVARIRHPGIVDVFGFGTLDDGRAYLIMEMLEGQSLGQRLCQGALPLSEALDVLDQVARALEAAHAKGITHRDLKPDNVFLQHVDGERPVVKILDFGLAKLARRDGRGPVTMTQSGQLLGTPLYMSPEQCRGRHVDGQTDVYALGCMAYELLCGRPPFNADNAAELIAAHLSELAPSPRALRADLPDVLVGLLTAAVTKDPVDRPTPHEFRGALADAGYTARASLFEFTGPVPRARRWRLGAAIGTAVIAVAVLAGMITGAIGRGSVATVPEVRLGTSEAVRQATSRVQFEAPVPAASVTAPEKVRRSIKKHTETVKKQVESNVTKTGDRDDPDKSTINPFRRNPTP